MTEAALTPEDSQTDPGSKHDRFIPVTLRRARFVAAIAFSGILFWTLGWVLAGPAAPHQTFTLLGWGDSPVVPALGLLVLLLVATIGSMAITHPDTPHAGLFCALLGMSVLAVRGGTIYPLLRIGDDAATVHHVYTSLAMECVMWAAILLIAEMVTGRIYARFFANSHWIERIATNPDDYRGRVPVPHAGGGFLAVGILTAAAVSTIADLFRKDKSKPLSPFVSNTLALVASTVVASILLPLFMQSEQKGQVLCAAFIVFGLAGYSGHSAMPLASALPILLSVPLTVFIWYFFADARLFFPGFSTTAVARALPIDYVTAGVAGALFGMYVSLRWRLGNVFEAEKS